MKTIDIRRTGKGAFTYAYSLSPSLEIVTRWGKTHGEQMLVGEGKYLLVDISNLGNHRCRIIQIDALGNEEILEQNPEPSKFCQFCDNPKYSNIIAGE